jgi:hypothetical protein
MALIFLRKLRELRLLPVEVQRFVVATIVLAVSDRPARADESAGVSIWFRSAEGCPDVDSFLARLATRNVRAHPAHVGESIDFVVTLGPTAGGSLGLLERQTSSGAVAIRRLDGDDCEQVADGIALGLALASEGARASATNDAVSRAPETPLAATTRPSLEILPLVPPSKSKDEGSTTVAPSRASPRPPEVWLGAGATMMTGIVGSVVPGAALFVEMYPNWDGALRGASFRLGAVGATRSEPVGGEQLEARLILGRLEGCPVSASTGVFLFSPCVSFDLGALEAKRDGRTSQQSGAVWASIGVKGRADLRLSDAWTLTGDFGAILPLTRYDLVAATGESLYYAGARFGASASLGVELRLP